MNAYIGRTWDNGVPAYGPYQMQSIVQIRFPMKTYLMVEVHPDSLWMPWYLVSIDPNLSTWWWFPGSYHERAATFSFTDGHAELHRWRSPSTMGPAAYSTRISDSPVDYLWMVDHATPRN
jgi:hypothetical protein